MYQRLLLAWGCVLLKICNKIIIYDCVEFFLFWMTLPTVGNLRTRKLYTIIFNRSTIFFLSGEAKGGGGGQRLFLLKGTFDVLYIIEIKFKNI